MAWLLGSGSLNKQPHGIASKNDDTQKLREHMMSVQKEMLGVGLPDPELFYGKGIEIPPLPEPPQLYIPKELNKIRHVMSSAVGPLFSDTAKDIIEDIEPGVHGFYPVNVEGCEEKGFTDKFYILNVRTCVKALCLEAPASQKFIQILSIPPEYRHKYFDDYRASVSFSHLAVRKHKGPELFVRKDVIAGRAIWAEYGTDRTSRGVYACDEFVKRMGRSKFGGYSPDVEVAEVDVCP